MRPLLITTTTDTIKINKALITDINYKDYDCVATKNTFIPIKYLEPVLMKPIIQRLLLPNCL